VKWGDQTWEEMQYTGFLYSVPSRRLKPWADGATADCADSRTARLPSGATAERRDCQRSQRL